MRRALLQALEWEGAEENWGVPYQERGIVGAVVYDTLGMHLPAKRMRVGTKWIWKRRTNIAYISNLAVAPGARRQGVASQLVRRCEEVARGEPRVVAVALHADPNNAPAVRLYQRLGYRKVVRGDGSRWAALAGLADPAPLLLMVKSLRRGAAEE